MNTANSTKLLYMEDFDVVSCAATVIKAETQEDELVDIVLDQTCFYPKGGGQDYDIGKIQCSNSSMDVTEVYIDEDGAVHHVGNSKGTFSSGDEVNCSVDEQRRETNTRLHSAGHVIDMVAELIRPEWVPGKGAHYPHMSFVEYTGEFDAEESAQIKDELQVALDKMVSKKTKNKIVFVTKDELAKVCRHVPEYIPNNKPTRVVMYDNFGVPCGGTHVKSIDEIGQVEITKVKRKNSNIRVSYKLAS